MRGSLIAVAAMLAGCATVPMTPERAEELCRQDLARADGVEGQVGVGIGNRGVSAGGTITIDNRVFDPQSEEAFMADCMARRMNGEALPATFGITLGANT